MARHRDLGSVIVLDDEPQDMGTVVVCDNEPSIEQDLFVVIDDLEDEKEQNFVCELCNVALNGKEQLEEHRKSKNHLKKETMNSTYDLDEKDMIVDVTTLAYKAVMGSKTMFIGAECIVTDREVGENKCLVCRVLLKDSPTILIHLRSVKHIHVYFKTRYPEVYRGIQRKARNRQEIQILVSRYVDELVRKYGGKKEPRVYQKGYYDSLSADKKQEIDLIVNRRKGELNEMMLERFRSPERRKSPERTSKSQRSPSPRHRGRSSRSPSTSSRYSRDRYADRDRYRDLHSSERSKEREYGNGRLSSPATRRHEYRTWSPDDRWKREVPVERSPSKIQQELVRMRPDADRPSINVDALEELPTDYDIFDTLCSAELVPFEKGERAFIQDVVDTMDMPIIGMDYVAEYSDAKGQYEPGYLCTLCECRLNPAQTVKHLVGDKHTMNYMKKHYPKKFTALCISTLGEEVRKQMKMKYLQEVAKTEGRRIITQKISLPMGSRQVFRHHKQIAPPKDIWNLNNAGLSSMGTPLGVSALENSSDVIAKPVLLYSEKSERARKLIEIERTLPLYCKKNLEEGWYSVRSKSLEYYEKLALNRNPNALYFSVRDPYGKEGFYGEWNPQLMRRLQDKFNFRLEHIRWLQKLLTEWRVPMYTPLHMADLRPLEQEVEGAVLNELLDQILKPVSTLRYMQTFEYENYDAEIREEEERKKRQEERRRLEEEEARRREEMRRKRALEEMVLAQSIRQERMAEEGQSPQVKVPRIVVEPERQEQMEHFKQSSSAEVAKPTTPGAVKAETEKEKKLRMLIDSVLRVAKRQGQQQKNAILQMVVDFPNAPEILFRLATRQPAQLQQLVTVAKNPMLTVPPGILEQLQKKLKEMESDLEAEKGDAERKWKEEQEEGERRKEEEIKNRVVAARLQLLKSRKEEENRRQALETVSKKPPHIHCLTPKLPGVPGTSTGLDPTGQQVPSATNTTILPSTMENMMKAAMSKVVGEVVTKLSSSGPGPQIPGSGPPVFGMPAPAGPLMAQAAPARPLMAQAVGHPQSVLGVNMIQGPRGPMIPSSQHAPLGGQIRPVPPFWALPQRLPFGPRF